MLENGRLSDRYRIGTDTGCIVSNRRPILRASLQVQHELLTGRIKQQIKGHSRRSPAGRVARPRGRLPRAGAPYDPGYGRGKEGDCNLIPASP